MLLIGRNFKKGTNTLFSVQWRSGQLAALVPERPKRVFAIEIEKGEKCGGNAEGRPVRSSPVSRTQMSLRKYRSISGWMRHHRPGTVHRLGDGLITHCDFSDAIRECHCQDSGRTARIFSAKNVFKPGFQAAQYLADSMEMWFIFLTPQRNHSIWRVFSSNV